MSLFPLPKGTFAMPSLSLKNFNRTRSDALCCQVPSQRKSGILRRAISAGAGVAMAAVLVAGVSACSSPSFPSGPVFSYDPGPSDGASGGVPDTLAEQANQFYDLPDVEAFYSGFGAVYPTVDMTNFNIVNLFNNWWESICYHHGTDGLWSEYLLGIADGHGQFYADNLTPPTGANCGTAYFSNEAGSDKDTDSVRVMQLEVGFTQVSARFEYGNRNWFFESVTPLEPSAPAVGGSS
jgi:hypothetical protein